MQYHLSLSVSYYWYLLLRAVEEARGMPPTSTPHTSDLNVVKWHSRRPVARYSHELSPGSKAYHLSFLRQKIIYQELSFMAIHFREILIIATEVPVLR
jgi:hypothetical protein